MNHVGHRVVAKIQQQLFDKLIGADLAFFHHNSPGTLISHFINDVNLLRNMASNTLTAIGKDSLTAIFLIGVMFAEDWLLALITTVILPLAILPSVRIGRSMRKVSGKNQVQVGRLTTLLDEARSEEHTSELQSLMRISYAVFCLKKKTQETIPQR